MIEPPFRNREARPRLIVDAGAVLQGQPVVSLSGTEWPVPGVVQRHPVQGLDEACHRSPKVSAAPLAIVSAPNPEIVPTVPAHRAGDRQAPAAAADQCPP